MKKVFYVSLILCISLFLTACGVPEEEYRAVATELAELKNDLVNLQKENVSLKKRIQELEEQNKKLEMRAQSQAKKVTETKKPASVVTKPVSKPKVSKVSRTYKVKPGDTLFRISKNLGVSVDSIKKKNNLKDNQIKVGQVLSIP